MIVTAAVKKLFPFQINEIPGVKIFKCNSPIYFANIDYFKEQLRDAVSWIFNGMLASFAK